MTERLFHTCTLCEAACGVELTVARQGGRRRVVRVRGDREDPFSQGFACPKAAAIPALMDDPDRVRMPLRRRGASWEEVGWEEALAEASDRLADLQQKHGRHSVGLYMGGPTLSDPGALLGGSILARSLGSRSIFSAAATRRLPHTLAALELFGHALLVPVPDLDRTSYLLLLGENPVVSNGSLLRAPGIGRRLRALRGRGGKLVVADPVRTETARVASLHLAIRPGGDAFFLLSLLQVIFAEERARPGRLQAFTNGLEAVQAVAARFPPERVAGVTGLAPELVRQVARDFAAAPSACCHGGMGLASGEHATLSAWLVTALHAATGNLDREGGALFTSPAVDLVSLLRGTLRLGHAGFHSRVRELPELAGELPPSALGEELDTPGEGRLRALVTVCGNPVLSAPNGARVDRALAGLDYLVAIDVYRNETTRHAHLILPTAIGFERDHLDLAFDLFAVRDVARFAPAALEPPAGVRDAWQVLVDLALGVRDQGGGRPGAMFGLALRAARALGLRRSLDLLLRRSPRHLTLSELERAPHGLDLGPLAPCLPERLLTPQQRIRLAPPIFLKEVERLEAALTEAAFASPPEPTSPLLLVTRRQLRGQSSFLHNLPSLARGRRTCTLWVHPEDAATRELVEGDPVIVRSATGEVRVTLEVTSRVVPGVVSLPLGYGHDRDGVAMAVARGLGGASVNDLTDDQRVDAFTGGAVLQGVPVTVEPAPP